LQKKLASKNTVDDNIKIHKPTDEELKNFCIGLIEFNRSKLLFDNVPKSTDFDKCIKADGEIIGGILAYTFWNMAVVDAIWVKETFRKNGYATALLSALENYAKEHTSTTIYFETFNPQMRSLCEKLGYTVYGVMANYPEGHDRYYMCKKICDR
jgi:RimJ/RimL family protein N-acetyltransferase